MVKIIILRFYSIFYTLVLVNDQQKVACNNQKIKICNYLRTVKKYNNSLMSHKGKYLYLQNKAQKQACFTSNHTELFNQLISLTKQNHKLKDQLYFVKQQLEQSQIVKNKYKHKYKALKTQILHNTAHRQNQTLYTHRQSPGKIYYQFKKQSTRKGSLEHSINITKEQNKIAKVKSQQNLNYLQLKNIDQQPSYHTKNYIQNQKGVELLQKIDQKFQTILQIISKIECQHKQAKINPAQQQIVQNAGQYQKLLEKLNQIEAHLKFTQQNQQNKLDLKQKLVEITYKDQDELNNKNFSKTQRNNIEISKKQYQNQIITEQKPAQKTIKSKSYKVFPPNSKLNMKNKKIKTNDQQDQYTKSNWDLLNQIGEKLLNWKIIDNQNSQQDNLQNLKSKVSIQQKQ